jgi:AbrB family looped-hinge helix DNA binding protein
MTRVVVSSRGQVTIPAKLREAAHLKAGDAVEVEVTPEGTLVLHPHPERDPDQWWFWTPEWQEGERRVDEEIARGEGTFYESGEAFLAALEAIDREVTENTAQQSA